MVIASMNFLFDLKVYYKDGLLYMLASHNLF